MVLAQRLPTVIKSVCCEAPAPGPLKAPQNWCQDRYQSNTFCCVEFPTNGAGKCPVGFARSEAVVLTREVGGFNLASTGIPCQGAGVSATGFSGCVVNPNDPRFINP
ncbi:hypothetical protein Ptr902_01549 [Pyrenophora tritici-repentis]|nr:hypothetical protein Ptr902_01549 [Pyrenophora tritici-repentis]